MGLNKSRGNMYTFVTHTHSHLGGECPHKCQYCYVGTSRFGRPARYTGELRLIEKEFEVNCGEGKSIFIEHCNDMFAKDVPDEFITRILAHCSTWPNNKYIFQTKNPTRIVSSTKNLWPFIPPKVLIGTTIESNRRHPAMGEAPSPDCRIKAITDIATLVDTFITIEPILKMDVEIMVDWIENSGVTFVNIGADSKKNDLPEPSADDIRELIEGLNEAHIEIREKHNLGRLLGTTT